MVLNKSYYWVLFFLFSSVINLILGVSSKLMYPTPSFSVSGLLALVFVSLAWFAYLYLFFKGEVVFEESPRAYQSPMAKRISEENRF